MKKMELLPCDIPLAADMSCHICEQFVAGKLAPELMLITGMMIAATGETMLKCLNYDEGSIDEVKACIDGVNVHQEERIKELYRRLNGEL